MSSLATFLFIAAILLLGWSTYALRKAGLPSSRVIYADTSKWNKTEKPLFDAKLNLTGKPDYLTLHRGKVVPVEVKSNRHVSEPYPSHVIQLVAYCYLVEHTYGKRPPYGILHYPHKSFTIAYTPSQAARLIALLDEVRSLENHADVPRSHNSKERCRSCGYREICDARLL